MTASATVVFFRVFDLADFFTPQEESDESRRRIHFLEQRMSRSSRDLFGYQDVARNSTPICDNGVMGNTDNWKFCSDEKANENQAYAAGWVRGTLLDRFFAPIYKYQKNLFDIIPDDTDCRVQCDFYRDTWIPTAVPIRSLLNSAVLTLSLSPYGIASVRLKFNIPVDLTVAGVGYGPEFRAVQQAVTPLFYSEAAGAGLAKVCSGAADFPNWLNFIALCAIWQFLKDLEEKKTDSQLHNCFKDKGAHAVGSRKPFKTLWDRCTKRPFPLRHEVAYYYFQNAGYDQASNPGFPDRNNLEGICQLGLLVAPWSAGSVGTGHALFATEVKDKVGEKDLCVTDNGCAFLLGNSLIVAVSPEQYCLQGSKVEEAGYWLWMFRLLCCMRECFILCDIGSRDVRKLRERYERARAACFVNGGEATVQQEVSFEEVSRSLLDELAQVASLLFVVEEGAHTVVASRVPFVQEKLRTFVDHLGLPDLLENVNKRRQRLEERIHNEMGRLSQGRVERLAVTSKKVADAGLVVTTDSKRIAIASAVAATVLSLSSIWIAVHSSTEDEQWKTTHAGQEEALLGALQTRPSQQSIDVLTKDGKRIADALERLSPPPPQPICCPQR